MAELALSWDLAEPFCRIREAIEEAQKGVRMKIHRTGTPTALATTASILRIRLSFAILLAFPSVELLPPAEGALAPVNLLGPTAVASLAAAVGDQHSHRRTPMRGPQL